MAEGGTGAFPVRGTGAPGEHVGRDVILRTVVRPKVYPESLADFQDRPAHGRSHAGIMENPPVMLDTHAVARSLTAAHFTGERRHVRRVGGGNR